MVNETHQVVSGLEKGKGGYGIRGVVPVTYNGEHIGSFEMGMNFDNQLLETFKNDFGPDVTVYFRDDLSKVESFDEETDAAETDSVYPVFASTMEEPPIPREEDLDEVFYSQNNKILYQGQNNIQYAEILVPIFDYSGDSVGVVQISIPRNETIESISQNSNFSLLISAGALLLFWV